MGRSPAIIPPLGLLLDVRPADEAQLAPVRGAVNIPVDELPERMHELPPRDEVVRLAATGEEARAAKALLEERGREVSLVTSEEADAPATLRLWRPNQWLEQVLPDLEPGRALDLACGSGRDSVFLAGFGWSVLAVDLLSDALDKGRDLECRYLRQQAEPIHWLCADIEDVGFEPGQLFDLIVIFRFLHRPLLLQAQRWLQPGGNLLLETFTPQHHQRHGRPRLDRTLEPEEASTLLPELEILEARTVDEGERQVARVWARAPRNDRPL
jgi:tellurite methyltransferase